jgi:hypothetical protein
VAAPPEACSTTATAPESYAARAKTRYGVGGRSDRTSRGTYIEPNLRVVRELDTGNDDPKMHFTVLVVEPLSRLRLERAG